MQVLTEPLKLHASAHRTPQASCKCSPNPSSFMQVLTELLKLHASAHRTSAKIQNKKYFVTNKVQILTFVVS